MTLGGIWVELPGCRILCNLSGSLGAVTKVNLSAFGYQKKAKLQADLDLERRSRTRDYGILSGVF